MFARRFHLVVAAALSLAALEARAQDAANKTESAKEVATEEAREVREAVAKVTNNNWLDLRVYIVANGFHYRLGNVWSFSTQTFKLPRRFVDAPSNARLVAYPIGARGGVATPSLLLHPGDVVDWRVENNPNFSTVSVWAGTE